MASPRAGPSRATSASGSPTAEDPRRFGKALAGDLAGLCRYRIGDYRLVVAFEDDRLVVLVVTFGHRREVYD